MAKHYVLAFMFSLDRKRVALIEKNRPEWQAGKINGIGGKVEQAEWAQDALAREFKEETGVETHGNHWEYFAQMIFENDILGGKACVHCFSMFSELIDEVKTTEDEKVSVYWLEGIDKWPLMENVPTLLAIALNERLSFTELSFK